jgi:archaellin
MESPVIIYRPNEIMGFRLNEGKYFQSKNINLNGEKHEVFLEFIIKGKANIYYFRDSNDHYFIETESVELLELTERSVVVNGDYSSFELPKRHKSKLKAILSDCPAIYPQIESVSLNHNSLKELARNYHYEICSTEDCVIFERPKTKTKIHLVALAGAGHYQIDLGSELTSNTNVTPTFGARMVITDFFAWTQRIGLTFDIFFQNFSTNTFAIQYGEIIRFSLDGIDYQYINSDFYEDSNDKIYADLDMFAMQLPISVVYSLGSNKVIPYIGAGIINQLVLSQNKDFLYDRFVDQYGKTVPTYFIGGTALLGNKFVISPSKAIIVEFNFEYTSNLNVNKSLKLKNSMFGAKLGYQFK